MIDARNQGRSSTAVEGPPPTDDLAVVVDRFGIERPTLVGHSMGAHATLDTAGHNIHREHFDRFVEVLGGWLP